MRGVQGCFLSGKSHIANDPQPREEVTAAIGKIEAKIHAALITVSDMDFVVGQ